MAQQFLRRPWIRREALSALLGAGGHGAGGSCEAGHDDIAGGARKVQIKETHMRAGRLVVHDKEDFVIVNLGVEAKQYLDEVSGGDPWSEVVKGCYALVDDFHFERVAVVDPSLTAAARSARPQKAMLVMHVSSLRCHGGVGIGTVGDPMDLNCRNDVVCALRGEKRAEPNREHGGSGGAAAGAASGAQIVGVDGSGRTTGYIASMMRVPMCQFVFAPPVHTDAAVESDLPFRHDGQLTKPTVDPATIQGVVDLAEMSATVVAEQRAAVQQAEDSVGAGAATPADATANHQTLSITGVSQKRVDTQELLAGFVSAARAETQPSHSAPWPGEAADQVAERDAVPDVDLDAEMLAGQEPIEVDECSSSEDERGAGAPAGVEATSIATATGFKLPRSDTAQLCGSTGQSHLAEAERMGPDVCSSVALMDLPEDGVPDNHAVGEAEAPTPPKSVQKTSDADHAADGPSAVHTRRLPSASSPFPLGQATPVGVAGALSPVSESDESEDLEASGSPITPKQPVPSQRRPLPGAFDDVSQLTFQTSTSMEASLSPSGEVWKTRMEPPHVAPSAESVGTSDSPRAQNRQARSAMENSERRTKSLPRRARKRSRHASPRRLVVLPHPAQPVGHLKAMLLMRGSQREVALNAAFEMSWDVSRVSASVDAGAHGAYAAGHRGKFSIVADASGPSQSAGRLQRKFLCRDKHEAYRARNSATGRLKSPALLSPLGSLPSSSSSSGASAPRKPQRRRRRHNSVRKSTKVGVGGMNELVGSDTDDMPTESHRLEDASRGHRSSHALVWKDPVAVDGHAVASSESIHMWLSTQQPDVAV